MTRYAVGDLQGCLDPLRRLLDKVRFDIDHDQLWCVGDLVNRGPKSLQTLRFIKNLGSSARVVLGNHDLHLLATYHGARTPNSTDTLQEILDAPDVEELLQWLSQQPLFYQDPSRDFCMVHAGIPPAWSVDKASILAREIENVIRSDNAREYYHAMYGNSPDTWKDELQGFERLRVATNYLTRMRFCADSGQLDLTNSGKVETASNGFLPWFSHSQRAARHNKIIFGHWAALEGNANTKNIYALDTGCVWGKKLTLFNLETEKRTSCSCGEE